MKLKIVTHYATDDPEFMSDHCGKDILDADGGIVAQFADSYHERTRAWDGFIRGVEWATGQAVEVEEVPIADVEI